MPIEELANELDINIEKAKNVLDVIKKFDPTGVGSKNLRECLLAQLEEKGMRCSLAWIIVDEHIYSLEKISQIKLAKKLRASPEHVRVAMGIIKNLIPKPASWHFAKPAQSIFPDLIVEEIDFRVDVVVIQFNGFV